MVGPVQRPALGIAVLMARYAMELERLAVEEKALFGVDGDGADAERLLDPVEQPPLRVANLGQDAIEIGVGQPVPAVRIGDAQPRLVTGDRIGGDRPLAVAARDDLAVRTEDRHPQPRPRRLPARLRQARAPPPPAPPPP